MLYSIPVEFHYYLWLPLVALMLSLAQKAGGRWWAAALAVCASVAALQLWPPSASEVNDVRLGPYLVLFFAGALAAVFSTAWAHSAPPSIPALGLLGTATSLALVATVPAVAALLGLAAYDPALNHRWFLFFGVAWSLLLLVVLHGSEAWRVLFEWGPMRTLGRISFSAYLWHMPVLAAVIGPLGLSGAAALMVFCASTMLLAWVSWRLIEAPLTRLRWAPRKPAGQANTSGRRG